MKIVNVLMCIAIVAVMAIPATAAIRPDIRDIDPNYQPIIMLADISADAPSPDELLCEPTAIQPDEIIEMMGFIYPDDGGDDFFVHHSEIKPEASSSTLNVDGNLYLCVDCCMDANGCYWLLCWNGTDLAIVSVDELGYWRVDLVDEGSELVAEVNAKAVFESNKSHIILLP